VKVIALDVIQDFGALQLYIYFTFWNQKKKNKNLFQQGIPQSIQLRVSFLGNLWELRFIVQTVFAN